MFQKFIIFLNLIIFLFSLTLLFAQDEEHKVIIISERVGEIIDLEERNYYRLFPEIKGFQSAEFIQIPDSAYSAKIVYIKDGTKKILFQRLTKSKIRRLMETIDRFEDIQKGVYKPKEGWNEQEVQLIKTYEEPNKLNHLKVSGEVMNGLGISALSGLIFGEGGPLYDKNNSDHPDFNWGFLIGSTLGSAFGVYLVGIMGEEEGSLMNTFLGSLIGTITSMGLIAAFDRDRDKNEPFDSAVLLLSQTAGSVMAFNLTRKRVVYIENKAILNFNESSWNLCCPIIYFESNPLMDDDWIQKVNLVNIHF